MVDLTEIPEDNRYGVFLSFRGADTRHTFTDHLHKALMDANIKTFLDDEQIDEGEDLKPELESAIKASKASIIVLSKNYATSTWCLDELVLILHQRLISDHIVIPIFYHVEPTDVRKQQKSFRDAMAKHKETMEKETNGEKKNQWAQKIDKWKNALTEVAKLKGKHTEGRRETMFIKELVTDIHRRIGRSPMTTLPELFGLEDSVEFVSSWLKNGSSDKDDILTILGIGGIGKTTLARYVYGLHAHLFPRSTFIENIGRKCTAHGLLDLQKKLCSDISTERLTQVHDTLEYTREIEKAVTRKKMFIILDDVNSVDQLNSLLGKRGFHPGSKIIITTINASLTKIYASSINPIVQTEHKTHVLKGLDLKGSLKLLSHHAFMSNSPKEGYQEVSEKLVRYCEGHPLALKVLGASMFDNTVAEWEDRLKVLKEETDDRIKKALQMSFDSIPLVNDKKLFKHISCFFVGLDRVLTATILDACKVHTLSGLRNLIDRCLLTIEPDGILVMHSLIQEMGRDVVRQESPEKPWKRSLLWCHQDSFKVLKKKKGTDIIEGLSLDMKMLEKEKIRGLSQLKTDALSEMDNLMILHLDYMQIDVSYENFPEELRWLRMHGFARKSIPSKLRTEYLVALDLSYSNIESFGTCCSNPQPLDSGRKQLFGSLKFLDLSFCERLNRLGGFFELPALKSLVVANCVSLIEICESIEQCVELVLIDLSYCNKLEKFPTAIGKLKKLETLLVDGCEPLIKVRDTDSQASSSAVMQSVGRYSIFFAISLPKSLVRLSLANNNLSTESFPTNFSNLSNVKYLCLDGNPIVCMPNCVRDLIRLEDLSMRECHMLMSIEHPPSTLQILNLKGSFGIPCYPKHLLRRIVFNPEMSPLKLLQAAQRSGTSSVVVEGIIKIQPMADVEEKVLHSLGWTDIDFIKGRRIKTCAYGGYETPEESQTQMYYEFGIFSTTYGGEDMPNFIRYRSQGEPIKFTIPSSPKKIRGLNFCCHILKDCPQETPGYFAVPRIKIRNITQNRTWIYYHNIYPGGFLLSGSECLIFLSHWMFRMNEMVGGDRVTISLQHLSFSSRTFSTKECGFSYVYNDESNEEEEEEDALGYYKSWNHVIGGDLSAFQLTTGEYSLFNDRWSFRRDHKTFGFNYNFKVDNVSFRAFSERKSDVLIRAHEMGGNTGIHGDTVEWNEDHEKYFLGILSEKVRKVPNGSPVFKETDWIEMDEQIFLKFAMRYGPEKLKAKYHRLRSINASTTGSQTSDEEHRLEEEFVTAGQHDDDSKSDWNVVFSNSTAPGTFHNASTTGPQTSDEEHKLEEEFVIAVQHDDDSESACSVSKKNKSDVGLESQLGKIRVRQTSGKYKLVAMTDAWSRSMNASTTDSQTSDEEHKLEEVFVTAGQHDDDSESAWSVSKKNKSDVGLESQPGKRRVRQTSGKDKLVTPTDAWSRSMNARTEKDLAKAKKYKVTSMMTELFTIQDCMSVLNEIPSVSTKSYHNVLQYFHDLNWRKIFLCMPEDRRKTWVDSL